MFCCCDDSWAANICEARALGTVTKSLLELSYPVERVQVLTEHQNLKPYIIIKQMKIKAARFVSGIYKIIR